VNLEHNFFFDMIQPTSTAEKYQIHNYESICMIFKGVMAKKVFSFWTSRL
jgi:hypothetical protein